MHFIKYLGWLLAIGFTVVIVTININLNQTETKEQATLTCVKQLNFIGSELKANGLGSQMQGIFPEGFVFTNALYGLAWSELGQSSSIPKPLQQRAIKESLYAYHQINSELGKHPFQKGLKPKYGVFYQGWKNYLLANLLLIPVKITERKELEKHLINNCEKIAQAIKDQNSPFLESYHSHCWPADMTMAIGALAIHDKLFPPKYTNVISKWISDVRLSQDTSTHLVPYKVRNGSIEEIESAKGNATALMLAVLPQIDSSYSFELYKQFENHFVETALGLPSVRHYTKNEYGTGDIDSGPVILGVGFAATIVAIRSFAYHNQMDKAQEQFATVNAFGLPIDSKTHKKYLLGKIALADAFVVWGRASMLKNTPNGYTFKNKSSFIKFRGISLLVLLMLWGLPLIKVLSYLKLKIKKS